MHLLDDGTLALSASDLTGYSACEHLTELELSVLRGERERPERDDPMLDVLSRGGGEHEEKQLERFHAEGLSVVEVEYPDNTTAGLSAAEAETLVAMQAGADVIYQATFFHDGWRGHADFLLRVDTPSPHLGAWSYDVADAKLARRVKAAALLQMCAYSEQVERLQGVSPTKMHVITGDGEQHSFKLTAYSAYYRALKTRDRRLVRSAARRRGRASVRRGSPSPWRHHATGVGHRGRAPSSGVTPDGPPVRWATA
jgi:predicted RecB family nuclease